MAAVKLSRQQTIRLARLAYPNDLLTYPGYDATDKALVRHGLAFVGEVCGWGSGWMITPAGREWLLAAVNDTGRQRLDDEAERLLGIACRNIAVMADPEITKSGYVLEWP